MKKAKRVNKVAPNMILNEVIVGHYHKDLFGRGTWTAKARRKMKERYFVSRVQYTKMEAPTRVAEKSNPSNLELHPN